ASFNDSLPVGLQVAATPGIVNTCGGTFAPGAGATTLSFSNSSLAVGACSITVNIAGVADNNYTNSVQILSSDAGNGNTSSANLTVINAPHTDKAFLPTTIPFGATTALTITVTSNSNQTLTLSGVAFTDNLPSGLVVATPSGVATTCAGGTATAV